MESDNEEFHNGEEEEEEEEEPRNKEEDTIYEDNDDDEEEEAARNTDLVKAATTRRYRENLMKDINVAFNRKSKLPEISVTSSDDPQGKVLVKAKVLEEKLNQIYEENNMKRRSHFNSAYEEWAAVAQDPNSTPRMPPKHFLGRKWFLPDSGKHGATDKVDGIDSSTKNKLHKIAEEFLTTERTYVANLRVLDQIFYKRLLEASEHRVIPGNVPNQIFQHLSAIFYFHSLYLLPQLEDRLARWEDEPRIGDVMMQAGPFLKMYAMYIDNHNKALETIQNWKKKSKKFSQIIEDIQTKEAKGNSLESCMLTPVQRMPRYKLLLERYLEKLPDDATQKREVETALNLVSVAATHSEQYIALKENSLKLVEIYESLVNVDFDTEGRSRELIKEGAVIKIAARSGKENNRYLYLFSDMLLCCRDCTSMQRLQGKTHQISVKFSLEGVMIFADEKTSQPTFILNGIEKHMEFLCRSIEVRDEWVREINQAVSVRIMNEKSFHHARSNSSGALEESASTGLMFTQKDGFLTPQIFRKRPLRKGGSLVTHTRKNFVKEETLGLRAPQWVKDHDVTMCMSCSEPFHPIVRRRHHCRACGRVVCSACSKKSVKLPYQPASPQRVCNQCFLIFNCVSISPSQSDEEKQSNSEDESLLSATFNVHHKQKWQRLWCVVPKATPHICICFKAKMDLKPFLLLSFNGCRISPLAKDSHRKSFELQDILGNKFVFASDDKEQIRKLEKLIKISVSGKNSVAKSVSVP